MPEQVMGMQGPGPVSPLELRRQCERLRSQLFLEQSSFLSHWKELAQYILPRRPRFYTTDVDKGDRRNQSIIDSTATQAAGTLASGMMYYITNPSRPWFKVTLSDAGLAEDQDAKMWLDDVQKKMESVFRASNFYNKCPIVYGDLGVFGTSALFIAEDDETVIHCYDQPIGSYMIANDHKMRIRTFVRPFRLTVDQVVQQWGKIDPKTGQPDFVARMGEGRQRGYDKDSAVSLSTQSLWRSGNTQSWVEVVHVIRTNLAYDGTKINAKYKRFEEIYYEQQGNSRAGSIDDTYGVLAHGGYDEWPVMAPRWETNSEDVYATNCPGMIALGDIKQLQKGEKQIAKALDKMIDPPLIGPGALKTAKVSLVPGDVTYADTRSGMEGLRPIHEVKFDASQMEGKQHEIRSRIEDTFYVKLFFGITDSDRRDMTAREVEERHEEKLLGLGGGVLTSIDQDFLDPAIFRVYSIMARRGMIPPPPPSIQGATWHIEYVSPLAQAQKAIALNSLERVTAFYGQVAQFDPSILDNLDVDELASEYADSAGAPPKLTRSKAAVQAARESRQQAAAQQQAAENAPKVAGAVSDLANAPIKGNNALAALLSKRQATATLNATARPMTQ